jgi:DNA-binding XRE family transcriptional regulator
MDVRIKERRQARCMTQADLAKAVGVSARSIYAIESGKQDPGITLVAKMAAELGCTIDELFSFENINYTTTTDKALWYASVVAYTATELGEDAEEVAYTFRKSGIGARVLSGYDVWHTQGYEYMGEVLSDRIREEAL